MRRIVLTLLIVSLAIAADSQLRGKAKSHSKQAPPLANQVQDIKSTTDYHINMEEAQKWDEVEVNSKDNKKHTFFSGFFEVVNPPAHSSLPAVEDLSEGQILALNVNKVTDEEIARIQAMPLEKPQPVVQAQPTQSSQQQPRSQQQTKSKEQVAKKAASKEASILDKVVQKNEDKKAVKVAQHKQNQAIDRILKKQTIALQLSQEEPVQNIPGDEVINMNKDIEGVDMQEGALEINDLTEDMSTDMSNYVAPQEESSSVVETTPQSDSTWGDQAQNDNTNQDTQNYVDYSNNENTQMNNDVSSYIQEGESSMLYGDSDFTATSQSDNTWGEQQAQGSDYTPGGLSLIQVAPEDQPVEATAQETNNNDDIQNFSTEVEPYHPEAAHKDEFDQNGVEVNQEQASSVSFLQMREDSEGDSPVEASANIDQTTPQMESYNPETIPTSQYDSNGVEIGLQSQPVSFLQVATNF